MKKALHILVVLTGVGFLILRTLSNRRKLKQIADNGYETALDILFPGKGIKSRKLHYGPVIPV